MLSSLCGWFLVLLEGCTAQSVPGKWVLSVGMHGVVETAIPRAHQSRSSIPGDRGHREEAVRAA